MCQEGMVGYHQHHHQDSSVLLDRAGHLRLINSRSLRDSHHTLLPLDPRIKKEKKFPTLVFLYSYTSYVMQVHEIFFSIPVEFE